MELLRRIKRFVFDDDRTSTACVLLIYVPLGVLLTLDRSLGWWLFQIPGNGGLALVYGSLTCLALAGAGGLLLRHAWSRCVSLAAVGGAGAYVACAFGWGGPGPTVLRISTLFLCASTGYLLPRIRITQQEQDDAEAREAYRAHVLGRLNDLMDRDPKLRAMLEERAQDGL